MGPVDLAAVAAPDPRGAQPTSWPLWKRQDRHYAQLARYVSAPALVGLRLVPQHSATDADADRRLAQELYETLCQRQIGAAREPWVAAAAHQQIRHPDWLVREGGNCLDVALTYGAMCLEGRVGAMLALTPPHVIPGHAFVVLTPGRLHANPGLGEPRVLPGLLPRSEREDGVTRVADVGELHAAIANGSVLAVDCARATGSSPASFADAIAAANNQLEEGLVLIDVPWLQTLRGMAPLPAPAKRPTIALHVPGGQDRFDDYRAHRDLVAQLAKLSGTVVLIGPPGQGKSTIARQIALDAPYGAGWFLNASEPQALINSLAEAELSELGDASEKLENPDRAAFAEGARTRLSLASDRWVVVLDNADGDPAELAPHLPAPGPDQLVLITTTKTAWERLPGLTIRPLRPIDDGDVARVLGSSDIDHLVQGRPLLLYAFKRLMNSTACSAAGIARKGAGVTRGDRGPAALWATLRDWHGFDDHARQASLHAAYLPPDHRPRTSSSSSPAATRMTTDVLVDGGLLTREVTGILRMHRLFGTAVRDDLEARCPQACDEAVLRIATTPAAIDLLDGHGDLATITRLAERLLRRDAAMTDTDAKLGGALHAVAALLELHGHVGPSGDVYGRAERHLEYVPAKLADCLHARARTVYRLFPKDESRLRAALEFSRRARNIGSEQAGGRYLAMQGLIMQKLAAFPTDGVTTTDLLHDALAVIEEADRLRRARTDISPAELARSQFNRAGIRIELAQAERRKAATYLDTAERVYTDVLKRRKRIFQRDVHAQIATCIVGLGYVDYYRAMLLAATPVERSTRLRDATNHAVDALRQSELLEGLVDLAESKKVARFFAKVSLARHAPRVEPRPVVEAVTREAMTELEKAPVQPLPPDGEGLDTAIAAWARSVPLARLVSAFDGEPPQTSDVGALLDWLEEFSARWDYRKGVERNLVAPQELSPETERLIVDMAHALGLVGTVEPPTRRYDHVLILGGLLRACFARPLHAAALLRPESASGEAQITAANVTALSGYRPLRGDELELVQSFERGDLTDEFDAMDAGVRAAFDLAEPVDERGEHSSVEGAAWRVRRYEAASGIPVHVIAAPSSEQGRRANTADTYRWFAKEHAQLARGERILLVTTDIYARYQHADALRMLALPYGVEIDAVGIQPGDLDPRLAQEFAPHHYLQEIRSTIRALRALHRERRAQTERGRTAR